MRVRSILLAFAIGLPAVAAARDVAFPAPDCRIGAYRFDDGRVLDVAPAPQGGPRWRLADGRFGVLAADGTSTLGSSGRADGHRLAFDCAAGRMTFDDVAARRIAFDTRETTFTSDGAVLAGRLVLPAGNAAVPVAVLVHGSESASARVFASWQRMLPALGVGAFVYDKRGTGGSQGTYTQDFHRLAADAAAAAREARRLAGARLSSLVYEGGSQGGWVVPLAQRIEPAERLIVGYGLTVSPLDENRSELLQALAARGYGAADLEAAGAVVDATGELMASGFRSGFRRLAALRRQYGTAPWYVEIQGEFSGALLRYPPWLLRVAAPLARRRSDRGTPWRYDPLPALRAADVPVLWVLAGADTEAPPGQTGRDLDALQGEGEAITVLEFPDTEHGIVEFETAPDGRRVTTRVADGYLRAVVDFARDGALAAGAYGRAMRRDPPLRTSSPTSGTTP